MVNQPKAKKIPERRCVGCGEHFPKRELIRVVRSPEGVVTLDFTGRAPGRGAYLCPSLACLKKARKAKRLEAAYEMGIEDAVYDALEEKLKDERPEK